MVPTMTRTSLVLVAALAFAAVPRIADAAGVAPSTASPAQHKQAQELFVEAKKAFDAGQYAAALDGFQKSYDTVASPNSHLFIARSLAQLGKPADAYRTYGLVSSEAAQAAVTDKKYEETKVAADAEQAEVRSKLAFVTVHLAHAPADASVTIGGTAVPNEALGGPVAVNPGSVQVVVSSASHAPEERAVVANAGEQKDVAVDFAPAPAAATASADASVDTGGPMTDAKRKHLRTAAYVAGGIGAAGIVTFVVAGSMARSQLSSLQDECNGHCPPGKQSDIDAGKRDQTIANVGLAVGILGLGAGTALYIFSRPKDHPATGSAPALVTAEVAAGPSWMGVKGTFQ